MLGQPRRRSHDTGSNVGLLVPNESAHHAGLVAGGSVPSRTLPAPAAKPVRPLLLVESSPSARAFLRRVLASAGFTVLGVPDGRQADAAMADATFGHAVVSLRLRDGDGLALVAKLRRLDPEIRIVVVTDVDSFASVILALRAGADDYLPTPINEAQLIAALLGRTPALPPVPEMPLGLNRTCWEHVMRIFEQCDRNVTHAARRLGMHRRSLQRFLSKRAPPPRALEPNATDRLATGAAVGPAHRSTVLKVDDPCANWDRR
jgi:two-component system response regulator RegA